jgi:hypothetical protein
LAPMPSPAAMPRPPRMMSMPAGELSRARAEQFPPNNERPLCGGYGTAAHDDHRTYRPRGAGSSIGRC